MTDQDLRTTDHAGHVTDVPSRPVEQRTLVILIAGFSAVLLASLVALLPVRYAVLHPGPVVNTLGTVQGKPLIVISGRRTYPTSGELDLTTVLMAGGPGRQITLLQVIEGWLNRSEAAVPLGELYPPGLTQEESDAENRAEMTSSQESATAAALSALGIDVPTTLRVAGLDPGAPAASVLKVGDVIESVNGTRITDLARLRRILATGRPDQEVAVRIRRTGQDSTVTTRTTASKQDGHPILGVYIDPTFSFPFSVKIQIEDVGGPSAGLMFALGIIDTLTPGDLTGGRRIAGTGTIDSDGAVGPIGGIQQKLLGARRAGAAFFLAPIDNCPEVRGRVPDGLRVVTVTDLADARSAVQAIARNQAAALPGC